VSPMTICTRWPTSTSSWVTQSAPAGYVVVSGTNSAACAYAGAGNPNTYGIRKL
jgi:hypothetical protein